MGLPARVCSHGYELATTSDAFGLLRESNDVVGDGAALRDRMAADGYVFVRGLIDVGVVEAARRELLGKLLSVDEIDPGPPLMDAVSSGRSSRHEFAGGNFAKHLQEGARIRGLVGDPAVLSFHETLLGEAVSRLDYIWLRTVRPGGATGCHYDWVYMGRGSKRLHTSWIPIGDVPYEDGALVVLEHSHLLDELINTYGRVDVDRDEPNPYGGGWFSKNWVEVHERFGRRWLTAGDGGFRAGDMLVLSMFTMHCSLDNISSAQRVRLSTDARYQPASDPMDERWVGSDPIGHNIRKG